MTIAALYHTLYVVYCNKNAPFINNQRSIMNTMNVPTNICFIGDSNGIVVDWKVFNSENDVISFMIPNDYRVDYLETYANDMPRLARQYGYIAVSKMVTVEIPRKV
jgi:hypothetical protein